MITLKKQYKRYSDYKDSGIEWIGGLPAEWMPKKFKYHALICNGKDQKDVLVDEGGYPVFGSGGEFGRANSYLYNKPSVLLGRKGTIDKPLFVTEPFWTVDTMFFTKISKNTHPRYFYYQCLGIEFDKYQYGSALPSMTQSTLSNIFFASPPKAEQVGIADYLDGKTALLNSVIKKKQKQIELLKEKRTALINKAVTKGLDDSVEMKDSGVEWIGEIPKEWKVEKLKFQSSYSFQYGANEAALDENRSNPRFVRITDIDKNGNLRDETFKSLEPHIAAPFLLRNGDILFARSGATVGKTFQYRNAWGKCCYAGYLIRMTPDENKIKSDYLYYLTKSPVYINWKNSIFIQATIQNISAEKYKNFLIPLSPILEQEKIIKYLDKEISKIDTTVQRVEQSIELLQEYKTSLISNVVTGKIKV